MSQSTFDTTGIDKSVHERLPGVSDAKLSVDAFWNPATGGISQVLGKLVQSEGAAMWARDAVEGSYSFGLVGLVTDAAVTRAATGALTTKFTIEADAGYGGWGVQGANASDASNAATHAVIDGGLRGPGITITAFSVANPTYITTSAPHGLTSGQSINITGSNSTPVADGDWVATVVDPTHITIPLNVTAGTSNAGTIKSTATFSGGWFLAMVQSISSGSILPKLQHSADNGVLDAFADLTSMVVGSGLTASTSVALVASPLGQMWKRYIKFVDTGTFTTCVWTGHITRQEP